MFPYVRSVPSEFCACQCEVSCQGSSLFLTFWGLSLRSKSNMHILWSEREKADWMHLEIRIVRICNFCRIKDLNEKDQLEYLKDHLSPL